MGEIIKTGGKMRFFLTFFLLVLSCSYALGVTGPSESEKLPIKGIWINTQTIAINDRDASHFDYRLHFSSDAAISKKDHAISLSSMNQGISLEYCGEFFQEDSLFYKRFDYLARDRYGKFSLQLDPQSVKEMLRGQVVVSKRDPYSGKILEIFALSHAGVIDQLFAYEGDDLGLSFKGHNPFFRLWSPTARTVKLHLYSGPDQSLELPFSPIAMKLDHQHTWSLLGNRDWKGAYYRYEITSYKRKEQRFTTELISDLYSVNTAGNGIFSQIVDIERDLYPEGWGAHRLQSKYSYDDWSDLAIYELHVRDFSYFDFSQPQSYRGKFLAFTNDESNGVKHIKRLADAGMTHLHLLPVNDQSSVNEIASERIDLSEQDFSYLQGLSSSSEEQQQRAGQWRLKDGFNWGYDPFHYQALEGSYASNPDDDSKILEFRKMIMAIHQLGMGVVSDVVYNHYTELKSLDAFVPDYFYNMNCGEITMESCCPDLATENQMVAKLIADSAVRMVKWYRLDAIRFDLMGFLTKDLILSIRQRLDVLTIDGDGIDGKKIFLYGEGWNFGPLVRKLPLQAATQSGAASMNIGLATFNDRFRDAVKGKGQNAHDLFVDDAFITDKVGQRETVLMGLMGSLKGVKGGTVNHPYESINYLTAHDKNTLWDTLVAKIGPFASTAQLVKIQQLAISVLSMAQGIPFFHAGMEILRSKSGDENSYDSGDWFNRIDYSYQSNGWGSGLPPAWVHDNLLAWGEWKYRLDYVSSPSRDDIVDTLEHTIDFLRIRKSSKLLRLGRREQVIEKLSFPYTILNRQNNFDPRLIAMKLDDTRGFPVDANIKKIWILINTSWDECLRLRDLDIREESFQLHPILKNSQNRKMQETLSFQCPDGLRLIDKKKGELAVPPQSALVFYSKK